MFPPPRPWKSLAPVEPEKSYVAFTSRFALRSIRQLPSFLRYGNQIMRQVEAAPGAVGYSLGGDLLKLHFHTLSAWEDDASLRAFVGASPHTTAARAFSQGMRVPSIFAHWTVRGAELPLRWPDALERQRSVSK
jgi:hypothetical protein